MEVFGNEIKQKISKKYCCEICDYNTNRKSNLNNHLLSAKHLKELNGNEIKQKLSTKHNCENCSKIYETSAGLWKHKKKCFQKENITEPVIEPENNISSDLILNIIQQNQEFKDLLLEQNKIIIEMSKNNNTTNINNSMNNSHNKTFNLQLFLNETCKDAMNIMDFVDSLKIQLSDIESIGELGFVNGISKFIIKNLKALDENMRPVHCSDPKRESLYVKDANVWEKEDSENKKIKKAIKYISHKNICAIPEWKAKYPDCIYSDSKKSNQYNHIVVEAMGGPGDNDAEKEDKIVKKIAKEVTITKG
jgi:ribosomal protein L37AE/L43A